MDQPGLDQQVCRISLFDQVAAEHSTGGVSDGMDQSIDRVFITLLTGRTQDRHGGGVSNRRSHPPILFALLRQSRFRRAFFATSSASFVAGAGRSLESAGLCFRLLPEPLESRRWLADGVLDIAVVR
jgi:hypothetical protein